MVADKVEAAAAVAAFEFVNVFNVFNVWMKLKLKVSPIRTSDETSFTLLCVLHHLFQYE